MHGTTRRRLRRRRPRLRATALGAATAVALLAASLPLTRLASVSASFTTVRSFGAASTSASATLSAITSTGTTTGDLLVAAIRDRNVSAPAPVTGVTDSAGNHWMPAAAVAGAQADAEIWYAAGAAALPATQSVTVTVGGTAASSSAIALTVLDVAGDAAPTLDATSTAVGTSTAASTGSATSTQPNELAIADIGWNSSVTPSSQSPGYATTASEQAKVSGDQAGEQAAWQILGAAGAQTYSATLSTSVAWTGVSATFRASTSSTPTPTATPTPPPAGTDWPRYLHDRTGSGFTTETVVNSSNAGSLAPKSGWPVSLGNGAVCPSSNDVCSNMVFSQPVVATVGGSTLVYVGSWNGSEYALCASSCTVGTTAYSSGQVVWSTYLGRSSGCGGPLNSKIQGVTTAAAFANVSIGGVSQPVVFVGGGGDIAESGAVLSGATAQVLALNALTGAVLWQASLGPAPATYSWSSPLYANGSVYVGVASLGDCPLVQGMVLQLNAGTGKLAHSFAVAPSGCLGAAVWASPVADPSGNVYVVTGNAGTCSSSEPYATAVLELSPSLALKGSWQVPAAELVPDSDFGATPSLFKGTVTPGGAMTSLLGASNKNGVYYVWKQGNVGAGPVARLRVSNGGGGNFKGSSIAPSSWDGTKLYIGGGNTSINSTAVVGSLRAFDPNNLSGPPLWEDGFTSGTVVGAVTSDPGLAVAGHAGTETIVDSATGAVLFTASAVGPASSFLGGSSIAHGVVYVGDTGGSLSAYSVNGV